jgi:hypothetical protein
MVAAYFYFMELSPDLQPEAEYDVSVAIRPRPTFVRNLNFWLLAMMLGSVLILLYPALTATSGKGSQGILLYAAGLSIVLSLAALPLLLPLLPWALTAPSVGLRWLRVFTLQSLSLGGLTALGYQLAGGHDHGGFGAVAPLVGSIYFVAGLLVAVVMYWPWLFRS